MVANQQEGTLNLTGFAEKMDNAMMAAESLICVGLDPDPVKLPGSLNNKRVDRAIIEFNKEIIDATADLVCAYKPNLAFYIRHGGAGLEALFKLREEIPASIPVILDVKVGDVGSSAEFYAAAYLDDWGFDAITANPYLGEDSLQPFMDRNDKGVIVLCKTSNPSSVELQDLPVMGGPASASVFERVARSIAAWDAVYPASIGLVAGATFPAQVERIRLLCPEQLILLPGAGAQAGDLMKSVRAGVDKRGRGLVVSSSRAILYASSEKDFASAAREATDRLRKQVNLIVAARPALPRVE